MDIRCFHQEGAHLSNMHMRFFHYNMLGFVHEIDFLSLYFILCKKRSQKLSISLK